MKDETIQFYIPYNRDGLAKLPAKIDDYWQWISEHGHIPEGKYSWTLQTYLYLRKSISCKITPIFPDKGIVVTHRDFIHFLKNPFTTVYLVCIKPDRKEHSWAHYHIVQNLNDDYIKKIVEIVLV
jgi:hypothetical protein